MAIVKCPHGHKYNTDLHKRCPYCAAVNDSEDWEEILPSEVMDEQNRDPMISRRFIVDDEKTPGLPAEEETLPVVGWLVCIEGPDKGIDFCLRGAKCTIGRKQSCSVSLSDTRISREGYPALIVYDDRKSHKFYLASGDAASHNNVELGGSMLLGQSLLNPYDEIRIEDTVLVFVPFCGDDFYWQD